MGGGPWRIVEERGENEAWGEEKKKKGAKGVSGVTGRVISLATRMSWFGSVIAGKSGGGWVAAVVGVQDVGVTVATGVKKIGRPPQEGRMFCGGFGSGVGLVGTRRRETGWVGSAGLGIIYSALFSAAIRWRLYGAVGPVRALNTVCALYGHRMRQIAYDAV